MKKILVILLFLFALKASFSSEYFRFILDNNVFISLKIERSLENEEEAIYTLEIENISKNNILVYGLNSTYQAKTMYNYVGLGLYSSLYPYLPEEMSKFKGLIQFDIIQSTEIKYVTFIEAYNGEESILFSIDYYVQKEGEGGLLSKEEYNQNQESFQFYLYPVSYNGED